MPVRIISSPQAENNRAPDKARVVSMLKKRKSGHDAKLYNQYLDWFIGDDAIQQYLRKHIRESAKQHESRQERSTYWNYCQPILELWAGYIFRQPITRMSEPPQLPISIMPEQKITPKAPPKKLTSGKADANTTDDNAIGQRYARQASGQEGMQDEFAMQEANAQADYGNKLNEESRVQEALVRYMEMQSKDTVFDQFWQDCDGHGTDINKFMEGIAPEIFALGWFAICVDMPMFDFEITNKYQEKQQKRAIPYLVAYRPQDVVNWEMGQDGKLLWVRFVESAQPSDDPFMSDDGKDVKVYRTWTRDHWYLHVVESGRGGGEEVVDALDGEHSVGEVPVTFVKARKSKRSKGIGSSDLVSLGKLNVQLYNLDSLITEFEYGQCLNVLTMKRSADPKSEIKLSENNILEYEDEPPQYLTPSESPGQFLSDREERIIEEMYRIAQLSGDRGSQGSQQDTGVAYQWEFSSTNQNLSKRAELFEESELDIARMVGGWLGEEFKGIVAYPDDFAIFDFEKEISLLMKAKGAIRSATFKREMEKKNASRFMTKWNQDVIDRVKAEIDVQEEPQPFNPFAAPGGGGQ